MSTGTLASSNEIIFGGVCTNGAFGSQPTQAGFTELDWVPSGTAASFAYKIVSSNVSVSYAPTWTSSTAYAAVIASFKAG
jgi:hypothetical protein